MTELLVVNSRVREVVKKLNMNISANFAEELSDKVEEIIREAVNRAEANNKKTVRGCDL